MTGTGKNTQKGKAAKKPARAGSRPIARKDSKAEMWKRKFEDEHERRVALLERMAERGLDADELLSEAGRDRLLIMRFLRETHGDISTSPRSLYLLPKSIRMEIRGFMYEKLGDDPRAHPRINEALAKPKASRRKRKEDAFHEPDRIF